MEKQDFIYVGFLERLCAYIIDNVALAILFVVLNVLRTSIINVFLISTIDTYLSKDYIFLVLALYFPIMESSHYQGTLGKIALGLKVTNLEGQRISMVTAIMRFLGRFLCSITLFLGYVLIFFTERKQGLHDIIASTTVLRKGKN
jgi:uncharacterized RDD family membrane protein YckC